MCGISCYFANEAAPSSEVLLNLLKYGEQRGTDALGFTLVGKDENFFGILNSGKVVGLGDLAKISSEVSDEMKVGDIFLANHRSAPETEVSSEDGASIQPIIDETNEIILVHNGAVSNFIYQELAKNNKANSELDSEAIIWSYLDHGRNMKRTMEYLSGGFAFVMVDMHRGKLFAVASHNPLYAGYVNGYGLFMSSLKEAIFSTISLIKGTTITRHNIAIWEDYYCQEIPANTIVEIDIESGMRNEMTFQPRYIHPNFDPLKRRTRKQKVLVSASGGLDSSTTLVVLKEAGYDVQAVHFKYGHRGEDCEYAAIRRVTKTLDIELSTFDISSNIKMLDSQSMLTDSTHPITTGTAEGLKTTVAWTCFRNGFFLTYMGALAESLIINDGYGDVFLTGGFMNLTESGVYPDNSERFINSFIKFANFASIVGTRIKPIHGCANLLKTEQYILLDKLGYLEELSPNLISCDRPKLIDDNPHNCQKDGLPACGSGLLSYWASKLAGVKDLRRYYDVDDPDYVAYNPPSNLEKKSVGMESILKKLQLHAINLRILQKKLIR